ncbi:hypothetical protein AAHH78_33185, partial [Burkholderia pseudomallei]
MGRSGEVDGKLALVRYTTEDRQQTEDMLTAIVESVQRYCEVATAYGPAEVPSNFLEFKELLDAESYDAIALCREKNAALVSIDARWRALALCGFKVSS